MSTYAGLVAAHGLAHSHRLVLDAVPAGAYLLDVGCATGYLAASLAERGCRVVGVEPDPEAAARARRPCEAVVEGDIELEATRRELPADFDVVVCADVLEHLRDPWETLSFLRTRLAPGGWALASVPNIAHWSARRALLSGRFPYADYGLFDRTHLRFFTRASARELAERAGFTVTTERFAVASLPLEHVLWRYLGGSEREPLPAVRRARDALAGRWPELFAFQFVLALAPREP